MKEVAPWRQGILSHHKRVKLTQKQMGDISPKVRKEVRERSGGICELRIRCHGAPAVQQAHLTGRKQLTHKTTADDLRDACIACHRYIDETPEGIRYKRKIRGDHNESA
ncbi:hypothetical protein EH198_16365 [Paenibacillus rhizophilus]|uniref:HNH endonuclease n=2 Tax=Paenibacillus rhizophilus TaxID=1850366 RepID=A0A3N9P2H2_9BACL|nr:hypothetical protein EH198_16365 [Paenibacillus rhizophilus]